VPKHVRISFAVSDAELKKGFEQIAGAL
jgi:hypothetical protein